MDVIPAADVTDGKNADTMETRCAKMLHNIETDGNGHGKRIGQQATDRVLRQGLGGFPVFSKAAAAYEPGNLVLEAKIKLGIAKRPETDVATNEGQEGKMAARLKSREAERASIPITEDAAVDNSGALRRPRGSANNGNAQA